MTQISLPIGPITAGFWLEPIVMVWQPLSLLVHKKPATGSEGPAVKLSSVVVSEPKTERNKLEFVVATCLLKTNYVSLTR
jgi:hypothetical protein